MRDLVLAIRRSKGMVLDPTDPDTRSAGSFFTNPLLDAEQLAIAEAGVERLGRSAEDMPRWPAGQGLTKGSAAWLIEASGCERGQRHGGAAISSKHSLALVNRAGATADDIVGLAGLIRRRVRDCFGITLVPEPVFVGFAASVDELLG